MNLLVLVHPIPVLADAGLPMISVTFPGMLLLLLPVIAIEAVVYRSRLSLPLKEALGISGVANAASTLAGIPLTWFVLVLCEMGFMAAASALPPKSQASAVERVVTVVVTAPWLPPPEGGLWRVPLAVLVLLVPFFFASVWVEALVVKRMLRKVPKELQGAESRIKNQFVAVKNANLLSYAMMFVLTTCWLLWSIQRHR